MELKIVDWDDVAFRQAVDRAWGTIRQGAVDIDSTTAAAHLQLLVRDAGYPQAVVDVHKTVDEALAHVAHFEVRRASASASARR
ncbi:MAG TPA: hypothetical protein VLS28_02805 [Candidatus Sulfomarinibacteraceae bacterium]|nr:hypothetical protein [Candidatus Sulfomarinibacteraceae bacterium]